MQGEPKSDHQVLTTQIARCAFDAAALLRGSGDMLAPDRVDTVIGDLEAIATTVDSLLREDPSSVRLARAQTQGAALLELLRSSQAGLRGPHLRRMFAAFFDSLGMVPSFDDVVAASP